MPEDRPLNGGELVEVRIDLDDIERGDDAPAALAAEIAKACNLLTNVWFASETETYNYGDSEAHYLIITGTPQADRAFLAKKKWEAMYG